MSPDVVQQFLNPDVDWMIRYDERWLWSLDIDLGETEQSLEDLRRHLQGNWASGMKEDTGGDRPRTPL